MGREILFVDDETGILNALKRLFGKDDYVIHTATSAKAGLEILSSHKIDIIVSDMRMPHMDGATFLAKAREMDASVIRIVLTGYADMDATIKAINDGGIFGYLSKPWDSNQLKGLINSALESRLHEKMKQMAVTSVIREKDSLKSKVESQKREMAMVDRYVRDADLSTQASYDHLEEVLINLLNMKDPRQRDICNQVAEIVVQVAKQLCLSDREIDLLYTSASLHSIGKIGLPDKILHSPVNALSKDELKQYLQYPADSACCLMAFRPYQEISKILTLQKSYLDGSGTALESETSELTIYSRILAVAIDYVDLRLGLYSGEKLSHENSIDALEIHATRYDERLIALISTTTMKVEECEMEADIQIPVPSLRIGMILNKSIYSDSGTLLLTKETHLTDTIIDQLQRIQRNVSKPMIVSVRYDMSTTSNKLNNHTVMRKSQSFKNNTIPMR